VSSELKNLSEITSASVQALAAAAKQTIADRLRTMQPRLPDVFLELSQAERQAVVEDFRRAVIIWESELSPVARDLRKLLRDVLEAGSY